MAELSEIIRRLSGKKSGKGRLDPAPGRPGIGVSISEAVPAAAQGGGIDSPLTEQEYPGEVWYQMVSSDGLFVLEYPEYTPYLDGIGRELNVAHIDRTPAAE